MTRPLRILVADDNPLNLRVAANVVRGMEHSGVLVTDGNQVISAMEKEPFDLVLLDVTMPEMDGLGALRHIRVQEQQGAKHTPVIMVTAHDSPSDKSMLLAAGADGYLAKPLEALQLQAELDRLFGV